MKKHIDFLINAQKHSQLVDQSQTIKSIKLMFLLDKEKGNFEIFENFLNELDSIIDEELQKTKKVLQVGA